MENPEMTSERALQILERRAIISQPTKQRVAVYRSANVYKRESDGELVYIYNTPFMTPYHSEVAQQAFVDSDFELAAKQGISFNARVNGREYKPANGETVDLVIDLVWSEKHQTNILAVVNCTPVAIDAKPTVKFSLNSIGAAKAQGKVEEMVNPSNSKAPKAATVPAEPTVD